MENKNDYRLSAKLVIFVWHEIAIETATIGTSFLRDVGVDARAL